MSSDRVVKRNYKFVPPDGGWGYMICLSVTIIFSCSTMFMACFGKIFDELLRSMGMGSTSVSLLSGVSGVSCALAGFATGPLLKLISKRKLALLGSLLYNLGIFATVFINTKVLFFIFQGIVQYVGLGLMYNLAVTVTNDYFVEKRLFCMSVAQSFTAVITIFAPQIIDWCSDRYGLNGTLLIISGVSLQTFVAAVMLQPVEWHIKKVEIFNSDENKQLLDVNKLPDENETAINKTHETKDPESGACGKKKININYIKEVFDIAGLRSFLKSSAFLGSILAVFSDYIFTLMLPQALYAMRWGQKAVILAISLNGLGDLVARLMFIFLNKWLSKLGIQDVFIFSLLIAFATRLCMLCSENRTSILVFIALIGVARSSIMILPPLIIAEVVAPEKFTSAMGMYMLATGVVSLVLGPAIGAVRDLTESYPTVFYMLSSTFAIVAMFWIIELCYKRNKHKRIKPMDKTKIKDVRK